MWIQKMQRACKKQVSIARRKYLLKAISNTMNEDSADIWAYPEFFQED